MMLRRYGYSHFFVGNFFFLLFLVMGISWSAPYLEDTGFSYTSGYLVNSSGQRYRTFTGNDPVDPVSGTLTRAGGVESNGSINDWKSGMRLGINLKKSGTSSSVWQYDFNSPRERTYWRILDQDLTSASVTVTAFLGGAQVPLSTANVRYSTSSTSTGNVYFTSSGAMVADCTTYKLSFHTFFEVSSSVDKIVFSYAGGTGDYIVTELMGTSSDVDYSDAPASYGSARHRYLTNNPLVLLGSQIDRRSFTNIASSYSNGAIGDDNSGNDDEDIAFPASNLSAGSTYSVSNLAVNQTSSPVNALAWIDWDNNGQFDADEASLPIVVPAGNSNITFDFVVPADFAQGASLYARFRIASETLSPSKPTGFSFDGEVEDHYIDSQTLPATLFQVVGRKKKNSAVVHFKTASETNNIGFQVYRIAGGEYDRWGELIPGKQFTSSSRSSYRVKLPVTDAVDRFAIATVGADGSEEFFGPFEFGECYFFQSIPPAVNSLSQLKEGLVAQGFRSFNGRYIRSRRLMGTQAHQKMAARYKTLLKRYTKIVQRRLKRQGLEVAELLVPATTSGFYAVEAQSLEEAGFKVIGKRSRNLGLTHLGVPVVRAIENLENGRVTSRSRFVFYHEALTGSLARYNPNAVYRVVDSKAAVRKVPFAAPSIVNPSSVGVQAKALRAYSAYDPSVGGDGWYLRRLLRRGSNNARSVLKLDLPATALEQGSISLELVGVTDWPSEEDHHVVVSVNGNEALDVRFDGQEKLTKVLDVKNFHPGENTVEVALIADTGERFDVVLVKELSCHFNALLSGSDSVSFQGDEPSYRVELQEGSGYVYGYSDSQGLTAIQSQSLGGNQTFGNPFSGEEGRFLVGEPTFVEDVQARSLKAVPKVRKRLAVVAHESFIGHEKLVEFVAAKEAAGWPTEVVSVEDIFVTTGHGYRSPDFIRDFLSRSNGLEAVLIVGGDSYDYWDRKGAGVGLVPTAYSGSEYLAQVPNDGLLTDFDQDGLGEIAVGRWPARTPDELAVIVDRSLAYEAHLTTAPSLSGVVVADKSFTDMGDLALGVVERSGVEGELLALDSFVEGGSLAQAYSSIRDGLKLLLTQGSDFLVYVGHGSAQKWGSKTAIFHEGNCSDQSFGRSPGVFVLACYSTDFVHPTTATLAHQLLFGSSHSKDGAAFVLGAASLSNVTDNLSGFASIMQDDKPLGVALQRLRSKHGPQDFAQSWVLLGDPSIVLPQVEETREEEPEALSFD